MLFPHPSPLESLFSCRIKGPSSQRGRSSSSYTTCAACEGLRWGVKFRPWPWKAPLDPQSRKARPGIQHRVLAACAVPSSWLVFHDQPGGHDSGTQFGPCSLSPLSPLSLSPGCPAAMTSDKLHATADRAHDYCGWLVLCPVHAGSLSMTLDNSQHWKQYPAMERVGSFREARNLIFSHVQPWR